MPGASTTTPECANCAKTKSSCSIDLKRCARCQKARYCSQECQKANWKDYKKVCVAVPNNSPTNPSPYTATGARQPLKGLTTAVDKPFHRLHSRTWLHDRAGRDVYILLIDTYRFRMDDEYTFEGEAGIDSIYGGAPNGRKGFRRFLSLVGTRRGLLPPWWSKDKAAECEALGMAVGSEWSSLQCAVEKSDIIEHYGNSLMPMQLRMFGERVYGRGSGGQSGAGMMEFQMSTESGARFGSVLDLRSMTG